VIHYQYVQYGDIIKGLPLKQGVYRGVYCSHVLEYLSLEDCRKALVNTYAMLKSGGVIRFVLPDIQTIVKNFVECETHDAALKLMEENGLGLEK